MERGRITILTGSPGTGKTSIARIVADESQLERSVHLHTDDFYHYLRKGQIPPHLPASNTQNGIVMQAIAQAARAYAMGGYDVIVDGIIGPWFLEPWYELTEEEEGPEVNYIILRASKEETLRRALARDKLDAATNREIVEVMWEQFTNLGPYETHVLETTELNTEETATQVLTLIEDRSCALRRPNSAPEPTPEQTR